MTGPPGPWRIPLARPDIDDSDRRAVLEVLATPVLSLGPQLAALEEEFRERFGGRRAVAVSSGTAGLYLALRALGVQDGEVITPSFGFIGTAHAIRLAGAEPCFVDVAPDTLCVTVESVAAGWSERTRAVIPVDLFGTPAPSDAIADLGNTRRVPVVEDSCEALGSVRQGQPVGTHGDAGVFAFYPNKQMTTGEGGLVVTRDDATAERIESMRNQGRGSAEFEFVGEGFNFRLTELQAALGRSQLARLDSLLSARQALAARYRDALASVPGIATLPEPEDGDQRSWFVFPVFVADPDWRAPVREALAGRGVQTAPYFPPLHGFAPYRASRRTPLPVTEAVGERSFAIPFHSLLRHQEADEVVGILAEALAPLAGESEPRSLPTLLSHGA